MILTSTNDIKIIYGRVRYTKPGSGNAKDRLTIVAIDEINQNGRSVDNKIKLLFWNNRRLPELAAWAAKLKKDEVISAKIRFDEGDMRKAVAYEFKRSGVYALRGEEYSYVVHGKAAAILRELKYTCVYIPIHRKVDGSWVDLWHIVYFAEDSAQVTANEIRNGDTIFACGKDLKKNGEFYEMHAMRIKYVHDTIAA